MNLRFTVTGEDYNEDIILHKTDNGHFDERAMQRLGRSGEEILWDLLGLLNTEEWHEAWMNAEIKTDQEIMILDHTLGVAIPIAPDYSVGTEFSVKTVGDISESRFSIHDKSFVFEWSKTGKIKTYTYEKKTTPAGAQANFQKKKVKPRTRVCVYA